MPLLWRGLYLSSWSGSDNSCSTNSCVWLGDDSGNRSPDKWMSNRVCSYTKILDCICKKDWSNYWHNWAIYQTLPLVPFLKKSSFWFKIIWNNRRKKFKGSFWLKIIWNNKKSKVRKNSTSAVSFFCTKIKLCR